MDKITNSDILKLNKYLNERIRVFTSYHGHLNKIPNIGKLLMVTDDCITICKSNSAFVQKVFSFKKNPLIEFILQENGEIIFQKKATT